MWLEVLGGARQRDGDQRRFADGRGKGEDSSAESVSQIPGGARREGGEDDCRGEFEGDEFIDLFYIYISALKK